MSRVPYVPRGPRGPREATGGNISTAWVPVTPQPTPQGGGGVYGTPPPQYFSPGTPSIPRIPTSNPMPNSDPNSHTSAVLLKSFVDNLVDNCDLFETHLNQSLNLSQAEFFANVISQGLHNVESQEINVVHMLGDLSKEPLVSASSIKARARRLLVECHARIDNSAPGASGMSPNVLQKIKLPTFNGEFSKWGNFRGLFQTLVDDRTDLSPIIKFNYLL